MASALSGIVEIVTKVDDELRAWWLVEFEVDGGHEDMATWLMMHLGALGCEIETKAQQDARPGSHNVNTHATASGDMIIIKATFDLDIFPEGNTASLAAALDEYGLSPSISTLRIRDLQEEDWLSKWKVGFEPFPVGERLLVCPAWLRKDLPTEQSQGRSVIVIEPGLAFGTGFHATTRFCLASVEKYVPSANRAIDVGTGSGILAIGAALLNAAAKIVAVENDPLACRVARENFGLNQVAERISLIEGTTDDLPADLRMQYDLILSNLTYEDNSALLPDYVKLARAETKFVFAGILKEKLNLMLGALDKHGFEVIEDEVGEMWAGLVAMLKGRR
jgi:ribosomal protein L11 methyltransferase